jgi:hypothetical protein
MHPTAAARTGIASRVHLLRRLRHPSSRIGDCSGDLLAPPSAKRYESGFRDGVRAVEPLVIGASDYYEISRREPDRLTRVQVAPQFTGDDPHHIDSVCLVESVRRR